MARKPAPIRLGTDVANAIRERLTKAIDTIDHAPPMSEEVRIFIDFELHDIIFDLQVEVDNGRIFVADA